MLKLLKMANHDVSLRNLEVVHVSAKLLTDNIELGNLQYYKRPFNFSDFLNDDFIPNIRYLKAYVNSAVGSTSPGGSGLNAEVKELDFAGTDLIKDSPQDVEAYLNLFSYNIPAASLISISAEVNGEPIATSYGRYTHLLSGFNIDTSVSIKVFYAILTTASSGVGGGGGTGGVQQMVAFGTDGKYYNIVVDPNQGSNNLRAELNSTAIVVVGNVSLDSNGNKYTIGVQVTADGITSVYADPI